MSAGTTEARVAARFGDDLARHGDRPALRTAAGPISYRELDRRVAASRDALERLAPPGGRHLVHLEPRPTVEFVVAWLAALTGNHTTLLTHLHGLATDYGASVTCGTSDAGGPWRLTGPPAPLLHPDLRLLLSTSGSTGSPKLVRLSADNLESNAAAIASYLGLESDDVALSTLPLDYCYGLSVLHSHLAVGASIVLDDRSVSDPELWAEARHHGVTSFAGVPYTFDLLGAAGWPDLATLRRVTQAGGRLAPERVRAIAEQGAREGWDLFVMYGQTEATARMAYLPPHLATTHPHAVGVAIPGGSFHLDPVDGATLDVGELVYTGPNVMMGYALAASDLSRGPELAELRTGDLARIGADGLVEIVGRRSRFAKIFGQRIDLDRVQALLTLAGHDAACAEAHDAEQLVVAVPGDPSGPTLAAVADTVATETGLPVHALRLVSITDLPRLPNGKLDQQAISRLEIADDEGSIRSSPASLIALYSRLLGQSEIEATDSFLTLGGDSLTYVELSFRLEERVGPLPPSWPRLTINELSALADERGPVRPRGGPRLARVDTTVFLRAAAIVLIVGAHTNLWLLMGGAHVLLAVVGANFARFQLIDEAAPQRARRILAATARIAVPAMAWIGAVALVSGQYQWRTALLANQLLGATHWSEPAWHYWFLEVIVLLSLTVGALASVPVLMNLERRHRFAVPATLTAAALVPRLWATETSYAGDVIHAVPFVAWLFFGGWAAATARNVPQRLLVTLLLLLGTIGFTDDSGRNAVIAVGMLALVWLPTIPWPHALRAPLGILAAASLYIYLTHWQVYPHLEDRWPLGGLVASIAVGIIAWQIAHRSSARMRRLLSRSDRKSS